MPTIHSVLATVMTTTSKFILVLVVLGTFLGVAVMMRPAGEDKKNGKTPEVRGVAEERLQLARTALAATEDLSTEEAAPAWASLSDQMPDDASIALNRALNQVLQVDSLTETANNTLLKAEERQAARVKLPVAIEAAREATKKYQAISDDVVTALWLDSRIDLREASLLPATMGKSIRRELFQRLGSAIQGEVATRPGSIILGGPFIEVVDSMEDPIKGLPTDVQNESAKALETLSKNHPDNLYLALRTARANIAAKNPAAIDAIERTGRLAAAIEPSLRAQTQPIGLTPEELVAKILAAVNEGQWTQAENQMLLWFNVLNGTELVKTDRRRTSPHPLDRLSFESLRELAAEVAKSQPAAALSTSLAFETIEIDSAQVALVIPLDFDLDLDVDIVACTEDGLVTVYRGESGTDWTTAGSVDVKIPVAGMLAADLFMVDSSDAQRLQAKPLRDDGGTATVVSGARHTSLASLVVFGSDGVKLLAVDGRAGSTDENRLVPVDTVTGLEDVKEVAAAIAGDFEGDGDLDLMFATRDRGLRIFVNRGNRTFFEAGGDNASELSQQTGVVAMAIVDLDRDLDLDVVTVDAATGQVGMIENLLHLQFRFGVLQDIPVLPGAHDIAIGDFDGNVSWDLLLTGDTEARVVFSQTAAAGAWTVDSIATIPAPDGIALAADFNNDSWYEMIVSHDTASNVAQLVGNAIDATVSKSAGIRLAPSSHHACDFDRDGKLDVLTLSQGKPTVSLNRTPGDGHHVAVRFKGIDDNNANSGRVNHYAIGSIVELRFGPHYRAQTITSPVTHFGLGSFADAGSMRVIFPNGLTQTIRDPKIDTLVEEEQTLKGSCPYLYAWDGEAFRFVTDCLWAAPLGLQVAEGVVVKDRPWEYLKVDGRFLSPKDGHYELRITEELWEVAYFDHVALTAIDHPADVQVWTNEKVGPAEIAEPTVYAFRRDEVHPLHSAIDTTGNDVTSQLAHVDQDFVQGFDRRICQGLCPPHWVDLDFGSLSNARESDGPIYLVMTGWILPTDTSLNIQIDQNPELPPIEFPSVWVPDANAEGGWRNAIPFMGFPGGKTKTIVVDVTDVIDVESARVRIRTSAQMYWDHAELALPSGTPEYAATELSLIQAELGYRGFSEKHKPAPTSPETYDYSRVSRQPKWPPLDGRYTSPGPSLALLQAWDDAMVVMGSGDELRLKFTVPTQPLREGWKRDFVLHCVGWDKDADLNTLTGQTSEPLPFKAMATYPPTLEQADQLQAVEKLNRDRLQRRQSYREFWAR